MMADGYIRATGRMAMAIAQNGPGITNFVTAVKTAYWNHSPLLLVTPQAANRTIGQGGFQEVEQMALFRDMVCYQEEVRDPVRIAEVLNRVIEKARRGSAPAQINVPRDFWTQVDRHRAAADRAAGAAGGRGAGGGGGGAAADRGAVPGDPERGGRGAGGRDRRRRRRWPSGWGRRSPAATSTTTPFRGAHPLSVGPLGYNGSKAAMELIAQADVVLALGTRLNPFSTLPGYGIDYWPKAAKVIQVDINADRIGLTKPVSVAIQGDARLVAEQLLAALGPRRRRRRAGGAGGAGAPDALGLAAGSSRRWTTRRTIRARPGTSGRGRRIRSG